MYNVRLDENKYYTGSYAKVGKVKDGVDLPSLPPEEDYEKALCYKYDEYSYEETTSMPKTQEVEKIDDVTGETITVTEFVLDEEGNVVYEDVIVTKTNIGWIFDEEKYIAYIEEKERIAKETFTPDEEQLLFNLDIDMRVCLLELGLV